MYSIIGHYGESQSNKTLKNFEDISLIFIIDKIKTTNEDRAFHNFKIKYSF